MLNLSLVNNLTIQFEALYVNYCSFIYRSNLYVLPIARLVVFMLTLSGRGVQQAYTRITHVKTPVKTHVSDCVPLRRKLTIHKRSVKGDRGLVALTNVERGEGEEKIAREQASFGLLLRFSLERRLFSREWRVLAG